MAITAAQVALQNLIDMYEAIDDVHPDGELKTDDEMAQEYTAINELAKQHGLEEEWEAWCIADGCA